MNIQSASTILKHLYPNAAVLNTKVYQEYSDMWAWAIVWYTINDLAAQHGKTYEWKSRMRGMSIAWRRLKRGNAQDFKARYLYHAAGRV